MRALYASTIKRICRNIRLCVFLFISLAAFITNADDNIPEHVEIKGKFLFNMRDSSGELQLGSYIESPSELVSASLCTLKITADDDYYNTYPIELNLNVIDGQIVSFIHVKSMYIDESSRYWNKTILDFSFSVADLIANNETWLQDTIKGNYLLVSPNLDSGQLAFHHLTMGQPLIIELTKQGKPSQVTINVPPLSAKLASVARKCMKLIDESV
jgi:hypothetical protein